MEDYLEKYHTHILGTFLPVMVIMGFICVLGIIANAFTIAFYGFASRKSPTVFMITALACVDMIVCVLIVPNMAEMGVNVKYTNVAACKTMHFFGHWAIETSALVLWFISIDRYRHVCCPFQSQVNNVKAKWAVGIIILVSFLMSVRDFANFDIIEFPVPNVPPNTTHWFGHYCTTTDNPNFKLSVTLFHAIDALVVVMVLVTLAFTYGKIIWTLKKDMFSSDEKHEKYKEDTNTSNLSDDTEACNEGSGHDKDKPETLDVKQHIPASEQHDQPIKHGGNAQTKIKRTERSITIMMLAVSIVFAVCFIPYFVVKLGVRNIKSTGQLELGAGIQLAVRLTYVNSFANPYIFCIFNPQFRRFIRRTVSWDKIKSLRSDKISSSQGAGTKDTGTAPKNNG